MVPMTTDLPVAAPVNACEHDDRATAIARIHDLFSAGDLPIERLFETLEGVIGAPGYAEMEAVMSTLPSLVRLTPPSRRYDRPLVLRVADGRLHLGPGWQMAAHTTVSTGFGACRLDLAAAHWDAPEVHLHLETWGSIKVVVPKGVAVQLEGGSGRIRLESLTPPLAGGPVLRVSMAGPAGSVRVGHPKPLPLRRRGRRAAAHAGSWR